MSPDNGPGGELQRVRDAYARRPARDHRYSWLDPAHLMMYQAVERRLVEALSRRRWVPGEGRVLEVGCGAAYWLREFMKFGHPPAQVVGADLLPARLREGRRLSPVGLGLACADGTALPFRAGSFEIVIQATMFSSILDPALRAAVAGEMARVVDPKGLILSYDFCVPNPANPDVRPLGRAELGRLFPGWQIRSRRVTLAPPLARRLAGYSWGLCRMLEWLPFLRTFLWAEITRPNGRAR